MMVEELKSLESITTTIAFRSIFLWTARPVAVLTRLFLRRRKWPEQVRDTVGQFCAEGWLLCLRQTNKSYAFLQVRIRTTNNKYSSVVALKSLLFGELPNLIEFTNLNGINHWLHVEARSLFLPVCIKYYVHITNTVTLLHKSIRRSAQLVRGDQPYCLLYKYKY
jgi:hypothetical protein